MAAQDVMMRSTDEPLRKQREVIGEHRRKMQRKKPLTAKERAKVSEKIKHLIDTGELPNTTAGRKKAAGMAYGMLRSGRLGRHGAYHRKG